jgi:hypothetical protein
MAMTPEQKAKLRRKAQAAFGEMDSELDLMNASDPFAELEEEEEEVQKPKARPKPKPKQPVVSATKDSLTTALVNDEPDTRRKIYTETTRTPTGGSRFTTTDPNQTQEGFQAQNAVRGVINEFRRSRSESPSSVIERLGRNQVLQMIKRDGGEEAVKYFEENY